MNESRRMTADKILEVRDWCVDNGIFAAIVSDLTKLAATVQAREWGRYEDVPIGVPFLILGGPGYSDIVMAKLEGGCLLNFGSDAKSLSCVLRVAEDVGRRGKRYVEFLGEVLWRENL